MFYDNDMFSPFGTISGVLQTDVHEVECNWPTVVYYHIGREGRTINPIQAPVHQGISEAVSNHGVKDLQQTEQRGRRMDCHHHQHQTMHHY